MPQAEFGESKPGHASLEESSVESILREVIAESASRLADVSTLPAAVLDRLRALAMQHPTEPFSAAPIGRTMVEIALQEFYRPGSYGSQEGWDYLCTRVSEALCDHAPSCNRLAAFWARLQDEEARAPAG
jgi:hypothetical protein